MNSLHHPRLGFDHDSGWSQLGASRRAPSRSVDFGRISDDAVKQMFGFEELEEVYLNSEIDDLLSDDDASEDFGLDEDVDDFDEDDRFGASAQPYVESQVRRSRRQEPQVRRPPRQASKPVYGSSCSCSGPSSSDRFGEDSYGGLVVPLPFIPEPPSRTDTFVDSAVMGAGVGLGVFGALWLVSSLARGMSS